MKLWKQAAAAIKDRKSLLAVGFSRRNPDLEAAIIHATSHEASSVDYANAHRVYKWIRTSPQNLRTLFLALSSRVNQTRSWIVSLKSLMLLHGVISCKVPSVVVEIRRLPFDLSEFSDGHSSLNKTWGFNIFVRSYFTFLNHYSAFLSDQIHRHRVMRKSGKGYSVNQDIVRIQKLQALLDLLLQIRPISDNMKKTLILEAMNCIVLESSNIYGRICIAIVKILPLAGKTEAAKTLKIIEKATSQGEDLTIYFDYCKNFGVTNARETPQFIRIPKEEVEAIKKTIKEEMPEEKKAMILLEKPEKAEEKNALVVLETPKLKTIVTDKWEIFEEDYYLNRKEEDAYQNHLPLLVMNQPGYINHTMPDLITF